MRDCENCKNHTDKGCTKWKCEFWPTTKNNLGVDCISREQALEPYKILKNTDKLSVYTIRQNLAGLSSIGRYDPYTDKFIKE